MGCFRLTQLAIIARLQHRYKNHNIFTEGTECLKQSEFAEAVRLLLEQNGFTKVKVSTALFSKKADISCWDKMGKKRQLKAELVYRKGKTFIQIKDPYSLDWIDRLEEWDALMN